MTWGRCWQQPRLPIPPTPPSWRRRTLPSWTRSASSVCACWREGVEPMSDTLVARQADLDRILAEAEALQKKYEGKKWEVEDRKKFDALCKEGDELQQDLA